jgi:hypothetical protein
MGRENLRLAAHPPSSLPADIACCPVANELGWLEDELCEAFGMISRARRSVVDSIAWVADLKSLQNGTYRSATGDVLLDVLREVQEAMWAKRVSVTQAEGIAKRSCPTDYADLVGLALDLGLAQTTLRGGSLVEVLQSLRSPVRKRLETITVKMLRCAADGYPITLLER